MEGTTMKNRTLGGIMKPDFEIEQDVKAELHYEPSIDPSEITVGCRDGIVTLSGSVSSYAEKESASWATERVSGVKARGGRPHSRSSARAAAQRSRHR